MAAASSLYRSRYGNNHAEVSAAARLALQTPRRVLNYHGAAGGRLRRPTLRLVCLGVSVDADLPTSGPAEGENKKQTPLHTVLPPLPPVAPPTDWRSSRAVCRGGVVYLGPRDGKRRVFLADPQGASAAPVLNKGTPRLGKSGREEPDNQEQDDESTGGVC
ncbi:hypothetical protein HPB50_007453 [Hyalomma asiaticum]|uniref:Uncharacterized protein n=1 Tax=Hyalomma asiaticum TaxID=266040 RepID=A0ACB7SLU8_HYAAI|nr:hypothetical protein HPB50_007453 [Hyalomma asiaticum]